MKYRLLALAITIGRVSAGLTRGEPRSRPFRVPGNEGVT